MNSLESNENSVHKEAGTKRVKREEEDVQRSLACFSSGLMTDPFTHETTDLLNFAIGVVLAGDLADGRIGNLYKERQRANVHFHREANQHKYHQLKSEDL